VPQTALDGGVQLSPRAADVPQTAEFPPGKTSRPQVTAVVTGTTKRMAALLAALFMVYKTIGFISDDIRFFMIFAFLLLAIVNQGACFIHRNTRAPDNACAPDYT
jgi:hypothetical protein